MKLVVFDLDGTLLNTLDDLADAANHALRQFGYPVHPVDSFRYFVGNGVPKLIERCLPESERSPEMIAEVKAAFDEYYGAHSTDKTRPYDGIEQLVTDLKKQGVKLAVASNKSDGFTRELVKKFFWDSFDHVRGGLPDVPKKPAPDVVFAIMERLGAKTEDTYFAGDSDVDMLTAKNAGITPIGCLWGFRTKEELESGGAEFLAEKPADIYNHIIYASHYCPVYNKIIDSDLCYESIMCLSGKITISCVEELHRIYDIDNARKVCNECTYSNL